MSPRPEQEADFRRSLPENPRSPDVAQLPGGALSAPTSLSTPQTLGTSFTGATISDTPGFVPPDSMGAVGPTQYIVTVNGRFRSFSKATGLADGALNVDPDVFFGSVRSAGTSDPRVRYDRLSGRWFITMIDVNGINNRILIAVSSGSTIASASSFTFFDIPSDSTAPARATSDFADYDTLGIDANALYIGTNVFSGTGAFKGTDGYVIRKSSVLGRRPHRCDGVPEHGARGRGRGRFTPQGVDNVDPNATEGSFIGVSNAFFGELVLRRVATPGGTPSISSNILITVPSTAFPLAAPQTGSTKTLDALDDRLFAATFRNGSLWTAHNIGVNSSGVAHLPDPYRRPVVRADGHPHRPDAIDRAVRNDLRRGRLQPAVLLHPLGDGVGPGACRLRVLHIRGERASQRGNGGAPGRRRPRNRRDHAALHEQHEHVRPSGRARSNDGVTTRTPRSTPWTT